VEERPVSADRGRVVTIGSILAALGCVAVAAVAWSARSNSEWQLRLAEQETAGLREQVATHESLQTLPDVPEERRWQLLKAPESVETLRYLQEVADSHNIQFDLQQALRSPQAGKQTFVLKGRTSPESFARFVIALEQGERLVVIENGRVLPSAGTVIAFELGVATYDVGGER